MPWKYYFCILKMKVRHLSILVSVLLAALLAGCGSGKHAQRVVRPDGVGGPSVVTTTGRGIDSKTAKDLEREARTWLGTKYKYAGDSKSGTDCSGLVMQVFLKVTAIKLPRNSAEQQKFCRSVDRRKLAPGDLVFFSSSRNGRVSHVGLYIGGGDFIHASTSRGVIVSNLSEKYYTDHYHSGGRVPDIAESTVEIIDVPAVSPLPVIINVDRPKKRDDRDDIYRRRSETIYEPPTNRDTDGERDDIYRSRKSSKTTVAPTVPPAGAQVEPPSAQQQPAGPVVIIEVPLDSLPSVPQPEAEIRNKVKNAF